MSPPRFLVVESETEAERDERRRSAGRSAGESYEATLMQMAPGCETARTNPSDLDAPLLTAEELAAFDGVFLSGSPLHVYDDAPEVRAQLRFMGHVFASGTPSFGSCAGLQVAVAAAGGKVRAMGEQREAGAARGITAVPGQEDHPLIRDRPASWDALTVHGDEVAELPPGATLLATSAGAHVQAAEIRVGDAVFWGVQYHPELAPGEVAAALRRDAGALVEAGLASDEAGVEEQAALFDRLHDEPDHRPTRWRLGVGGELAREERRRVELRAFLEHLVEEVRRARGRQVPEPA